MKYEEIKTPKELYSYMKENIKYGYYSKIDNKYYIRSKLNNDLLYEQRLFKSYYLQSPEELLNSKIGLCYDQVELIKKWLITNNYKVHTYYTNFHNHAFLIYEDNNKYYLFERCIKKFNGIYENNNLDLLLNYYKELQLKGNPNISFNIYEYKQVKYGSDFWDFILNATNDNLFVNELKVKLLK